MNIIAIANAYVTAKHDFMAVTQTLPSSCPASLHNLAGPPIYGLSKLIFQIHQGRWRLLLGLCAQGPYCFPLDRFLGCLPSFCASFSMLSLKDIKIAPR